MNDEDEIGNWGRGLVPEGLNEGSQAIYCLKFIEKGFPSRGGLADFAAKRLYRTAQGFSPGSREREIRPACPP